MSCELYRFESLSHPSVDLPRDVIIEFQSVCLLFRWDDQGCHIDNRSYQWECFQWIRHTLLVSRRSNHDESRSSTWQCRWLAPRQSSSFTRRCFLLGKRFSSRKSTAVGSWMSCLRQTIQRGNSARESHFRTFDLHRRAANIIAACQSETTVGMQTVHGDIHIECFVEPTQETQ